jgi:3-deoxy-D-arabino-heptulosonate 7-phosphate (DAHP) synthase class II
MHASDGAAVPLIRPLTLHFFSKITWIYYYISLQAYLELAKNVDQAVQFMNAAGLQSSSPIMAETEFYVSHEALLLDYEQALTRLDSTTGRWCVPRTAAQHAPASSNGSSGRRLCCLSRLCTSAHAGALEC